MAPPPACQPCRRLASPEATGYQKTQIANGGFECYSSELATIQILRPQPTSNTILNPAPLVQHNPSPRFPRLASVENRSRLVSVAKRNISVSSRHFCSFFLAIFDDFLLDLVRVVMYTRIYEAIRIPHRRHTLA